MILPGRARCQDLRIKNPGSNVQPPACPCFLRKARGKRLLYLRCFYCGTFESSFKSPIPAAATIVATKVMADKEKHWAVSRSSRNAKTVGVSVIAETQSQSFFDSFIMKKGRNSVSVRSQQFCRKILVCNMVFGLNKTGPHACCVVSSWGVRVPAEVGEYISEKMLQSMRDNFHNERGIVRFSELNLRRASLRAAEARIMATDGMLLSNKSRRVEEVEEAEDEQEGGRCTARAAASNAADKMTTWRMIQGTSTSRLSA